MFAKLQKIGDNTKKIIKNIVMGKKKREKVIMYLKKVK